MSSTPDHHRPPISRRVQVASLSLGAAIILAIGGPGSALADALTAPFSGGGSPPARVADPVLTVSNGPAPSGSTTPPAASPRPRTPHRDVNAGRTRIITASGLRHLRQAGVAGQDAARTLFNNEHTFVVLKPGQKPPHGWTGQPTMLFTSYADFARAARGGFRKDITAVVYDNEGWGNTPAREQADPAKYAKKFEHLAHRLGLVFIAAPTRLFLAGDAPYADIVDIQLQGRERHGGSYSRALRHEARMVRRVNGDAKIVAEITSNPEHLSADGSPSRRDIKKAIDDITRNAGVTDGFWPWIYQQNGTGIRAGVKAMEEAARRAQRGIQL